MVKGRRGITLINDTTRVSGLDSPVDRFFPLAYSKATSVRRGSCINTGHCPETSRDANGLNRYYRIKVLLNVAE